MTFPSGGYHILALVTILISATWARAEPPPEKPLFARDNLVAWCIVPFDAARRGPAERAQMLKQLGISRLAYDWRNEHVPTFEQEILELKKHDIAFFAFWGQHDEMFRLFEKHRLTPQVWQTAPSPNGNAREERIEASVKSLMPLVERTRKLGCKLGLYNHGGWGGEPANLVAVCRRLRERAGADHVGIVYNLHHGHDHLADFAESLEKMKPFLLCLNLNGMNDRAMPKILPLGQGKHDTKLFQIIRASGYRGPIGLLDHRPELDAEKSLRANLDGLKHLLHEVGDAAALKTYR